MEYKDSRQFPLSLTVGITLLQRSGYESWLKAICPENNAIIYIKKAQQTKLVRLA